MDDLIKEKLKELDSAINGDYLHPETEHLRAFEREQEQGLAEIREEKLEYVMKQKLCECNATPHHRWCPAWDDRYDY